MWQVEFDPVPQVIHYIDMNTIYKSDMCEVVNKIVHPMKEHVK